VASCRADTNKGCQKSTNRKEDRISKKNRPDVGYLKTVLSDVASKKNPEEKKKKEIMVVLSRTKNPTIQTNRNERR
jgi:hypothetical protein